MSNFSARSRPNRYSFFASSDEEVTGILSVSALALATFVVLFRLTCAPWAMTAPDRARIREKISGHLFSMGFLLRGLVGQTFLSVAFSNRVNGQTRKSLMDRLESLSYDDNRKTK